MPYCLSNTTINDHCCCSSSFQSHGSVWYNLDTKMMHIQGTSIICFSLIYPDCLSWISYPKNSLNTCPLCLEIFSHLFYNYSDNARWCLHIWYNSILYWCNWTPILWYQLTWDPILVATRSPTSTYYW